MNWKKELLQNFKLYAITDLKTFDPKFPERVEQAFRGGVDIIQLRSKELPDVRFLEIGRIIRMIAEKRRKLFFVNDRVDLAIILKADGVHLGQDDLPIVAAKKLMGKNKLFIGRSTHSLAQASQAEKEGADYIGFGPIFTTPTKPTYRPIGFENIAMLKRVTKIPFVCIGGIDESNVDQLLCAGAERIAVVRAIFDQVDTFRAAQRLKEKLT